MRSWFSRRLESLIDNLVFAGLVAVGAVIWSLLKSLPPPLIFTVGLVTFVSIVGLLRLLLSFLDRINKGVVTNTSTGTSGTIVITQKDSSKENYEQIKSSILADVQSGKIKVKGMVKGGLDNISLADKSFIIMLSKQMEFVYDHGHDDIIGLLADRASGVELNELITRNCTQCGRPRNKREDGK